MSMAVWLWRAQSAAIARLHSRKNRMMTLRGAALICRSLAVAMSVLLGACGGAPLQDGNVAAAPRETAAPAAVAGVRTTPVVAGRAARVFVFAGVDEACRPLPEPQLSVAKPPAKGEVTFKPGQATTIAASGGGTCIGATATGTGVYYTARPGSIGSDSFAVAAKLSTGEAMTRDFRVEIAE